MKLSVLILIILLSVTRVSANDLGYATSLDGQLWLVDFTAKTSNSIGDTGLIFQAIALRADGVLFGTTNSGKLYTINTTTASPTLIGNTTLGDIESLDFSVNSLLAMDFSQRSPVYEIEQTTAVPNIVTTPNYQIGSVRAAAVMDTDTWIARGDELSPSLYKIDLSTGDTELFRISDTFLEMYGMDYINGQLYGVGESGKLYRINNSNGLPGTFGDTGNQFYLGLTALTDGTVPEPTSVVTAVVGSLCILLLRLRSPSI